MHSEAGRSDWLAWEIVRDRGRGEHDGRTMGSDFRGYCGQQSSLIAQSPGPGSFLLTLLRS
jgi:hypothetical protein